MSGRCSAQVDPCHGKVERCGEGAATIGALGRQVDLAAAHSSSLTFAVSVIIRLRYELAHIHVVADDMHTVVDPAHVFLELGGAATDLTPYCGAARAVGRVLSEVSPCQTPTT